MRTNRPSPSVAATVMLLIDGTGAPPISDARVIDLSDQTLLPGFIDAHSHLTYPLTGTPGWESALVLWTQADFALIGAQHAREVPESGFTSGRDAGARHFSDVALRNAINEG
ncbi:amidohydrolase family protein [Candidatus Palauibacter sp.]|uniref:amidohydrolase family protein n=1 Tax=Candidatus Palauibacter sp. TaxID=3101350 RepID=UPI003AF214D1